MTGRTTSGDQFEWCNRPVDCSEQPVRPVEVATEKKAKFAMPISIPCDGKTPLICSVQGDEGLEDHDATPRKQQYGAQ